MPLKTLIASCFFLALVGFIVWPISHHRTLHYKFRSETCGMVVTLNSGIAQFYLWRGDVGRTCGFYTWARNDDGTGAFTANWGSALEATVAILKFPLWFYCGLLMLAPTTVLGWVYIRNVSRRRAGGCSVCAYDLRGNVSGRCPECGTDRPPS